MGASLIAFVGWVERSDTHPDRRVVDGFRCALPILQFVFQPLARNNRPFSRDQSRFFSLSRLSCSFLPLAIASSSLARPRSLKYSFKGISVMPSRSTAPINLLICFLCSSSFRGRLGSWLKRLA